MAYVRNGSDASSGGSNGRKKETTAENIELRSTPSSENEIGGAHKLTEANCIEKTGYVFSTRKKWWILTVVALCQTSMSEWLDLSSCIFDTGADNE
jgi:hypothetical protein